jgi:predicted dehydrogenase
MSAKVFHIPLIAVTSGLTLHSIVQRTPVPGNDASKDHPGVKLYNSADAMISDPSIDLIVITTTPDSHFALSKSALEAGKHILVEKPFVPTSEQADELVKIAKQSKRLICVYQNRRWDSDFLTFRKLQAEGTLGRIAEFETHFDRFKPVRPENWKGNLGMADAGGVIYDLGTHLIDQIVFAFGLPEKVTGIFQVSRADGAKEPDAITVLLQYKDGLLATAKAAVISIESEQLRYWVRGTEGSYKKFHLDVQEDQLKAGLKPGDKDFGIESEKAAGTLTKLEGSKPVTTVLKNVEPETYKALYVQFQKAILAEDDSIVPVKASEARDVLRVIEAARESAEKGLTVML